MNGRRRFLLGTVLAIQSGGFSYPACQDCCSRLILTSRRYECPKCGSSYQDAAHRYKLCVKVSEERRLHVITVFGKCLEKVFGADADFLHSHLQAVSGLSGDLEDGGAQDLLFHAAERCLVGRSLIFAVKIPENSARSDSLSHSNLQRDIIACQIILLKEDPVSCTILSYFNQLVASTLNKNSINAKTDISLDITSRDLSILGSSDRDSSLHQSWNRYADYWQQSLGLVSSLQSSTLSPCYNYKPGESSGAEQVLYPEALTLHNSAVSIKPNSADMATRSTSIVSISAPSVNCSSSIHTNTHSPPHSSRFQSFSYKSEMALGQESYLQNVCKSGSCRSQSCSERTMQLLPQPAETNQAKEEIWEDFPFSESLSEFIAKIEDEGVGHHSAATESTRSTSKGRECRRSCTLTNVPDAQPIQNYAVVKEASPCRFVRCSNKDCNSCIVSQPYQVTRKGDANQTLPSADLCSFQKSFKKSGLLDVLSRASTKKQDRQSSSCAKMLLNGIYINDSLDLCSFIALDKTATSWEKGISSRRHNVDDEQKCSDVEMVKPTMTGDNYNASADLFEASNDPEADVISQSRCIGSPNGGQERFLLSITGSACTDVLPYWHGGSRRSVNSLENYETWNYLPTGDFIPNLQSTPVLRRLSGTSRIAVDPWCLNMTSNSKSSIRNKSSSTIRHILLKNTKQRKSARFYGLPENVSVWSPNLPPFSNFDGSIALIPKNRLLADRLRKRGTVSENKENYNDQTGHNKGSDGDTMCTVKRADRINSGREETIKRGGDAQDSLVYLSPLSRSLQEKEDQQLLPKDWSPELFSEKSNVSQPSDRLQRRLF